MVLKRKWKVMILYKCMYPCICPISTKYWLYSAVCVAQIASDENSSYFQYDGKVSLFVAKQRHYLLITSVTWHTVLINITVTLKHVPHVLSLVHHWILIWVLEYLMLIPSKFSDKHIAVLTCKIVLYCVTVCNKEETKLQWNGWSQWENQLSECQACLGRPQLSAELVSHSTIQFLSLSDDNHWLASQKVQRNPHMWTTPWRNANKIDALYGNVKS